MSDLATVLLIAGLVLVAAVAVMAETAITRIGRARAHVLSQVETRKGAQRLLQIVENPAPYMNVVLLLMLLAHVTATALAVGLAIRQFDRLGQLVAAVVMTIVIFVFAEIAPKTYTIQHTERTALFMARPVHFVGTLLSPVGKLLILLGNAVMFVLPGRYATGPVCHRGRDPPSR